jgi:hypothetical protein
VWLSRIYRGFRSCCSWRGPRLKRGPHETFCEALLQFARISKAGDLDQD